LRGLGFQCRNPITGGLQFFLGRFRASREVLDARHILGASLLTLGAMLRRRLRFRFRLSRGWFWLRL
jgi:hypothetical protein